MRGAGLSEEEVLSVNLITSYFNFVNRVANGLGVESARSQQPVYQIVVLTSWGWLLRKYNLGLLYKILGRWSDSARCNRRAVELDPEDGDAWWNLGIAATARADWALARSAWQRCGIEMSDGSDEPRMNYGLVPIRLSSAAEGEVVWCDRIDPARAIIRNIPLPSSGHREGDLLLHDGAPNGYRIWNDREYPVFDALQVLMPSERNTYEALVEVGEQAEFAALEELAESIGIVVEDWETLTWLCKQCSEGTPHAEHDHSPGPWKRERRVAFSARTEAELARLLDAWTSAASGARVLRVQCASETR